jgi:FkbM family methyltransferase
LKQFIANIICANIIGKFLSLIFNYKIPSIRYNKLLINCKSKYIENKTIAQIFWGIYESAEINFSNKYIPNNSIIVELGGSIGVLSSFIIKYKNPNFITIVEPNPTLIPIIENNINFPNSKIINAAISNNIDENIFFNFGSDNTTGFISDVSSNNSIAIKSINFDQLITDTIINKTFILISDIEGAEFFVFNDFNTQFQNISLIIIELHDFYFNNFLYDVRYIYDKIINKGFLELDRHGNCFVFKNIKHI